MLSQNVTFWCITFDITNLKERSFSCLYMTTELVKKINKNTLFENMLLFNIAHNFNQQVTGRNLKVQHVGNTSEAREVAQIYEE